MIFHMVPCGSKKIKGSWKLKGWLLQIPSQESRGIEHSSIFCAQARTFNISIQGKLTQGQGFPESCDFKANPVQQSSAHSLCTQWAPSLSLWPGPTPGSGAPVAAGNQFLPAASQGQENSERAALEANHLLTLYLPSQPLLQALLKVRRWRCVCT